MVAVIRATVSKFQESLMEIGMIGLGRTGALKRQKFGGLM